MFPFCYLSLRSKVLKKSAKKTILSISTASRSTQVFDYSTSDGANPLHVKAKKPRASGNKPPAPPAAMKNDKAVKKSTQSQVNCSNLESKSSDDKNNSTSKISSVCPSKTQARIIQTRRQLSRERSVTPVLDVLDKNPPVTDLQEDSVFTSQRDSSVAITFSSSSENCDSQSSSLHILAARNPTGSKNTRRAKCFDSTRSETSAAKRPRIEDKIMSKTTSQSSLPVISKIATRTRSTKSRTEEVVKSSMEDLLDYSVKKVQRDVCIPAASRH